MRTSELRLCVCAVIDDAMQVLAEYYNHQCTRHTDECDKEGALHLDLSKSLLGLTQQHATAYKARQSQRTTELATTMAAMVPVQQQLSI